MQLIQINERVWLNTSHIISIHKLQTGHYEVWMAAQADVQVDGEDYCFLVAKLYEPTFVEWLKESTYSHDTHRTYRGGDEWQRWMEQRGSEDMEVDGE